MTWWQYFLWIYLSLIPIYTAGVVITFYKYHALDRYSALMWPFILQAYLYRNDPRMGNYYRYVFKMWWGKEAKP